MTTEDTNGNGPKQSWEEIVELKKNIQKSALKPYLNEEQDDLSAEIVALDDLTDLCEKLLSQTWTAEAVVKAYIRQAAAAHEKVYCQ